MSTKISILKYNNRFYRIIGLSFVVSFSCLGVIFGFGLYTWIVAIYFTFLVGVKLWLGIKDSMKIFGEVFSKQEYQTRQSDLFGTYFNIGGLEFSEKIFDYPLFIWSNNADECFVQILNEAKSKKIPVVIFDQDYDWFYKFCALDDIWLNFSSKEKGYGWDFAGDYKKNPKIAKYMQKNVSCKCENYLACFRFNCDEKNTQSFLDKLCFMSIDKVINAIKKIVPKLYKPDVEHIRLSLEKEYKYLALIPESIGEKTDVSIIRDNGVVWVENYIPELSRFILDTAPNNMLCIVRQKNSHDIRRKKTIVINSDLNEFYVRFDGSLLSLNSDNTEIASLFGRTTITNIRVCGNWYNNVNHPAVSKNDFKGVFFNYYNQNDILRIYDNRSRFTVILDNLKTVLRNNLKLTRTKNSEDIFNVIRRSPPAL